MPRDQGLCSCLIETIPLKSVQYLQQSDVLRRDYLKAFLCSAVVFVGRIIDPLKLLVQGLQGST